MNGSMMVAINFGVLLKEATTTTLGVITLHGLKLLRVTWVNAALYVLFKGHIWRTKKRRRRDTKRFLPVIQGGIFMIPIQGHILLKSNVADPPVWEGFILFF